MQSQRAKPNQGQCSLDRPALLILQRFVLTVIPPSAAFAVICKLKGDLYAYYNIKWSDPLTHTFVEGNGNLLFSCTCVHTRYNIHTHLVIIIVVGCGHCKAMKPAYEEAATALKSEGAEGKLAAADATISRDLSEKYGVKGFPTVIYFKYVI